MKNHAFQIQVPTPCHADWNKMTPTEKGKFCASCEKEVVDLTPLSDRELIKFFEHKQENTCGRLKPMQLDRNLNHHIQPNASKRILYTILFGGLAIGQVTGQTAITPPITGNIELVEPLVQGKIAVHQHDEFTIIKGKVLDEANEIIIGATIVLKNTSIGTQTNIDGDFELRIPKDKLKDMSPVLIIRYIGFDKQEIKVTSSSDLKIILIDSSYLLGEIIYIDNRPKHEKILDKIVSKIPVLRFKKKIRTKKIKAKSKKISTKLMDEKSKPIEEKTAIEKIETTSQIKVYPNPFDNQLKLSFIAPEKGRYQIEILSIDAKRVFKSNLTLTAGENTSTIPLPSTLPSGQYILFIEGHGVKESEIIIKE